VVILVASAIVVLLSIRLREETDESGRHGGRNQHQPTRSPLHHFYRHDHLVVYVNNDGLSHGLDAVEQRELDELIQAARSLAEDGERSRK
jgi:hypothetical protein